MTNVISHREVIEIWLSRFEEALTRNDMPALSRLFESDCYWRDLVAFTWNIVVFEGFGKIAEMLSVRLAETAPSTFVANRTKAMNGVVQGSFAFETRVGRGAGYLRLRDGLCWTLLTTLTEIKGHEEPLRERRDPVNVAGQPAPKGNWFERRRDHEATLGISEQPFVAIVGGGQAGLGLSARLKMLAVPTIVVDRHPRPGGRLEKTLQESAYT